MFYSLALWQKPASFKIRKKIPLDSLKDSIKNQLKRNENISKELYPDKSSWHTLEDLKIFVKDELKIGPALFGPKRKNNDFNRRILDVLFRLQKENIVERRDFDKKPSFRLIEPQKHKFVQIKPLTLVTKPPTYNNCSKILFGEEKDMKRVFNSILDHGVKDDTYIYVNHPA